jgi:hypothetical protein
VEGARTNIYIYSEQLDNAAWNKTRITVTANQAVAPDGTTTADLLTATSTLGKNIGKTSFSLLNATTYTGSWYVKAGTTDKCIVRRTVGNALPDPTIGHYFDLTLGTLVGTPAEGTCRIDDVGNGWFRCSWTATTTSAGTDSIGLYILDDNGDLSYTAAGETLYAWGAQLEIGASPSSYIPSTTAFTTRAKDSIQSSDVTWFNQTEGSIYHKASVESNDAVSVIFCAALSSNDRMFTAAQSPDGGATWRSFTTVGTRGDIEGTIDYVEGVSSRQVTGYAIDDAVVYMDGSNAGVEASVTLPSSGTFDTFYVGISNTGGGALNGHIAELRYYDERLANSVLEGMSNDIFPEGNTRNWLAVSRRKLDRPPTKRVYPKPKPNMRDTYE